MENYLQQQILTKIASAKKMLKYQMFSNMTQQLGYFCKIRTAQQL